MTAIDDLVGRAIGLARTDDVHAAVAALGDASPFELKAAFARAKRLDTRPDEAAAADLLEVAVAVRRRGAAFGRSRWWHRTELSAGLLVGMLLLQLANLTMLSRSQGGWLSAIGPAIPVAVVVLAVPWVRSLRRRPVPLPSGPMHPRSSGRINEVADAVADEARRTDTDDVEELADALAARARTFGTGVAAPLVALGGLSVAERTFAGSFDPRRTTIIRALRTARERSGVVPPRRR